MSRAVNGTAVSRPSCRAMYQYRSPWGRCAAVVTKYGNRGQAGGAVRQTACPRRQCCPLARSACVRVTPQASRIRYVTLSTRQGAGSEPVSSMCALDGRAAPLHPGRVGASPEDAGRPEGGDRSGEAAWAAHAVALGSLADLFSQVAVAAPASTEATPAQAPPAQGPVPRRTATSLPGPGMARGQAPGRAGASSAFEDAAFQGRPAKGSCTVAPVKAHGATPDSPAPPASSRQPRMGHHYASATGPDEELPACALPVRPAAR